MEACYSILFFDSRSRSGLVETERCAPDRAHAQHEHEKVPAAYLAACVQIHLGRRLERRPPNEIQAFLRE